MMKRLVLRNAQICNRIDALDSSIEIANATALLYLEKDVSVYPNRRFHAI